MFPNCLEGSKLQLSKLLWKDVSLAIEQAGKVFFQDLIGFDSNIHKGKLWGAGVEGGHSDLWQVSLDMLLKG